jgi:hypothetical protein
MVVMVMVVFGIFQDIREEEEGYITLVVSFSRRSHPLVINKSSF